MSALARNNSRFLRRMVSALVTRFTMKCPQGLHEAGYIEGTSIAIEHR